MIAKIVNKANGKRKIHALQKNTQCSTAKLVQKENTKFTHFKTIHNAQLQTLSLFYHRQVPSALVLVESSKGSFIFLSLQSICASSFVTYFSSFNLSKPNLPIRNFIRSISKLYKDTLTSFSSCKTVIRP